MYNEYFNIWRIPSSKRKEKEGGTTSKRYRSAVHRTFLQRELIKRVSFTWTKSPRRSFLGFPSTLSRFPRSSSLGRFPIAPGSKRSINLNFTLKMTEASLCYSQRIQNFSASMPKLTNYANEKVEIPRTLQTLSFKPCTRFLSNFILTNKHMEVSYEFLDKWLYMEVHFFK